MVVILTAVLLATMLYFTRRQDITFLSTVPSPSRIFDSMEPAFSECLRTWDWEGALRTECAEVSRNLRRTVADAVPPCPQSSGLAVSCL